MIIPPFKLDHWYAGAMMGEFHRAFKRDFFAMNYGNYLAKQVYRDFCSMYCMGGEL